MRTPRALGFAGRVLAGLGVMAVGVSVAFGATARSAAATWGVTPEQAAAPMPGDELVRGESAQTTRGVTIEAPAGDVWPWVAQLGAGRGGLYSYDWLERLVGANMTNADRVLPDEQDLAVGDLVWITPEGYPANLVFKVAAVDPGRSLVLAQTERPHDPGLPADPGWTWSILLRPVDARTTQLIVRDRQQPFPNPIARALNGALIEPIGFAMERKMLLGIERRAEGLAGTGGGSSPAEPIWFAALLFGAYPNPAAGLLADGGIAAAVALTCRAVGSSPPGPTTADGETVGGLERSPRRGCR